MTCGSICSLGTGQPWHNGANRQLRRCHHLPLMLLLALTTCEFCKLCETCFSSRVRFTYFSKVTSTDNQTELRRIQLARGGVAR
eukprot:3939726-Amphidinium_carterae.1